MISRKILMMEQDEKIWTFLLENDEIVEMHCDTPDTDGAGKYVIGSIYVGRVKNIVPNIGAAFIEVEPGVECYYDVSQAASAVFTKKIGKKPLCIGDELVVQITKEAMKTKVPTVSSHLSFTGHYVILTTGNTRIGTSGKLPKARREELKELLRPYHNEEYGIIVRTNAKDVELSEIVEEMERLKERYIRLKQTACTRTCFSCLYQAPPSYITNLKNVYTEGLHQILVEGSKLHACIQKYFAKEQPEKLGLLKLYADPMLSLGNLYQTRRAVAEAFSQRVWLKNGAYLVIQYTEALTVIDVNSGKYIAKKNPMETYLKINLEAARETAKQIRLRNLSGIILVDFINLDNEQAMQELLRVLKQELAKDPIQANFVDVTKLQLVEITRKKVSRPIYESIKNCNNTD